MRLMIYGSGAFAPTVIELVRACGHEAVGMIDDTRSGEDLLGSFEEVTRSHPPKDFGIALAIGYNNFPGRWIAWQRIRAVGYDAPVLIHPRAYVADSAKIEQGTMIMAGATIDVRAKIGAACVIWPGVCVSHDTSVGANCFISPNATVCGFVNIGESTFVGAAASIADGCEVPASSFIKMHSLYKEGRKK